MKKDGADKEVTAIFKKLLNEYFNTDNLSFQNINDEVVTNTDSDTPIDLEHEKQLVDKFLSKSCGCGCNCQKQFTSEEIFNARIKFQKLTTTEKNCFILSQLFSFLRYSAYAYSARTTTPRKRQKFEYKINADRPVCKEFFLFYYGESIDRLKRLQKNLFTQGIELHLYMETKVANQFIRDQCKNKKP
jgi:hypothetical protein